MIFLNKLIPKFSVKIYCNILLFNVLFCLTFSAQDLSAKHLNGKWGYVNKTGMWVVKPKFKQARDFKQGLGAVLKGKKWGFINAEGKFVVKPNYAHVLDFSEGRSAVWSYKPFESEFKYDYAKRKWGYINKIGELVVPYSYRSAKRFKNGIALVSNWGQHEKEQYMIDSSGNSLSVPFIRKEIYNDTLLHLVNVREDGDSVYKYVKSTGRDVTDWFVKDFEFKNFPVQVFLPSSVDDKVAEAFKGSAKTTFIAMLNEKGEVFTEWFNAIGEFNRGFAPVRYNHRWGFVDSSYSWVSRPVYRDIEFLKDGYYEGQLSSSASVLINSKGERLSHRVENIEVFDSTFFIADYTIDNRRGKNQFVSLMDTLGDQRTGWYHKINPFQIGISRVLDIKNTLFMNDSVGLKGWYNYVVDTSGSVLCFWRPEIIVEWKLKERKLKDSVLSFLYAPNANKKLTPEYFQTICLKTFDYEKRNKKMVFRGGEFSEGMALVGRKVGVVRKEINGITYIMDDVRYGYIDWMGKQVIPYRYKEATNFSGGKAIVFDGGYYGAIDFKGRTIIKPQYQLMGSFGSGLAPVFKDGLWGYVNSKNKRVIDYQFEDVRPFRFGYAAVKQGRNWGVIDVKGNLVLGYDYRKPPKPKSSTKIEVLKKGVGYTEIEL